jgi:hypothetical protein
MGLRVMATSSAVDAVQPGGVWAEGGRVVDGARPIGGLASERQLEGSSSLAGPLGVPADTGDCERRLTHRVGPWPTRHGDGDRGEYGKQ